MNGLIINDVLTAMQRRELKVFYQPKYDAITTRLKSAEALIRWIREDGSIIQPAQFLSSMEQTGAITMLDWYVVEEVCAFLERLKGENIMPRPVSVNFSRWHLHEEDAVKRMVGIVDSHHLDHRLIVVEITESAMVDDEERMREMVDELHTNGFEFSIDDFGSGLSSLSMVADTLPDEIKIDRSLLKRNCEDERERIILESIFLFANRLQMRTVAEGVETKEQLYFLRTCNCNLIQGYYFAKPLPEDEYKKCLINKDKNVKEEDILKTQSETAAVQLLLQAVFMRYPLIIYGNLTRNSFYMITYDNFTSRGCPSTGSFDDLIEHGTMSMHPEDRERWNQTFRRDNQLKLYHKGETQIHLITRQIGDDGIYRKVETSNYFVKSPASDDVLIISLCNNFEDSEER
jgi:EAL domain-containing protein (putative c-di-GMP-specific phosphodiesterase class I)